MGHANCLSYVNATQWGNDGYAIWHKASQPSFRGDALSWSGDDALEIGVLAVAVPLLVAVPEGLPLAGT
uniref:Uncharacterized protein n=1 Tax=Nelumbo nucifera TaxID=4432 RepID=A0A822XFH2_NELNU|nr:TPA_asm: hypothetical protein HUJ06_019222 [Nelumbo nucifera]